MYHCLYMSIFAPNVCRDVPKIREIRDTKSFKSRVQMAVSGEVSYMTDNRSIFNLLDI